MYKLYILGTQAWRNQPHECSKIDFLNLEYGDTHEALVVTIQ
jgi:hypothetical protein